MSWETFKTFNSKLTGKDVFNKEKYRRQQVKEFLKALQNDPKGYGIMETEHQRGVKTLYKEIISEYVDPIYSDLESQKIKAHLQYPSPRAEVKGPIKVKYYSIELDIRDFDSALGYIFSVCPLPAKHTASNTYLPLLAIYCKFIELMTDPSTGAGMNKTPTTACIVVGAPPKQGGVKAIMFGSTIRSNNKNQLQGHRYTQLVNAYKSLPEVEGGIFQKFGHCAETYPYICNINPTQKVRKFEGPVQGIAVNVQDVANMAGFALLKFPHSSWKGPCGNCMELLNLGGFPAYDIFPHAAPPSS